MSRIFASSPNLSGVLTAMPYSMRRCSSVTFIRSSDGRCLRVAATLRGVTYSPPPPPGAGQTGPARPYPIPDDDPARAYTLAQIMPARRRRFPWLAVVLVVLAVAGIGAGSYILVRGLGETARPAAQPSPPGPTLVTAATPASTIKTDIAVWLATGGQQILDSLMNDFNAFQGYSDTDLSQLRSGCVAIQKDVEAAQAYRAVPDQEAQSAWSEMLAADARAATDCIAGVDAHSTVVVRRATDEFGQALVAQKRFLARLELLANG